MTLDELNDKVDRALAGALVKDKSHCCTRGCCACCYEVVYASNLEARGIAEALGEEGRFALVPALVEWLERTKDIRAVRRPDAIMWRKLALPCPLLSNFECSVYARRPFSCRTFFAIGKAQDCYDIERRPQQKFAILPQEFLATVMCNVLKAEPELEMDILGCLLAEEILGGSWASASRQSVGAMGA